MLYIYGDADWTEKVRTEIPPNVLDLHIIIIQLDRAEDGTYASKHSVGKAVKAVQESNASVILVGSCPKQDYVTSNPELWELLPANRVQFYDASRGTKDFSHFLESIQRP